MRNKIKEAALVVNYLPIHKATFRSLNYEWITKYFALEELDHQILDYPESYILNRVGLS